MEDYAGPTPEIQKNIFTNTVLTSILIQQLI